MRAALTAALPHLGSGEAVPVAWRVRARSGDGPQRPVKEWQIFKTETAALKAIRLFPLTGEIEPLYLHPAPPSSGLMEEVKALRQIISECAEACGAGIAPTASIEFMAKLPDEIRLSAKLKDATP